MEEYMMSVIKRASIFMILAQAFVHFRPSPIYEKYFKFLTGMMTTVILIVPIAELFKKDIMTEYETAMLKYMETARLLSEEEVLQVTTPAASYLNSMQEEIKSKLNKFLLKEGYVVQKVELKGIEDENVAESTIKIQLVPAGEGASEVFIPKVEKIEVKKNADESADLTASEAKTDLEKRFQDEIAQILEIEKTSVEVEIFE